MFKELNVLKVFFESPTREFNVRELAKLTDITPATSSKYLKEYCKEKILKYRKEHNLDLYKANIESEAYRDLKVYYNIRRIRESGLIEALNEFYLKPTIILFGSFAIGYDAEKSDIDIVVVSERIKVFLAKEKYEKILKKPLQIFNVKNLKELKNKHLINSILNGLILQGEL